MSTTTSPTAEEEPPWSHYRIGRGETGVLTHEPYKSALLPLWRFRTRDLALKSSSDLWDAFLAYEAEDDFVGMDMARKFLQMGMTRAKRYANHKGGKKYAPGGEILDGDGGDGWKGSEGWREKDEASRIFRKVWERARTMKGYQAKKAEFLKRQKEWDKRRKDGLVKGSGKRETTKADL